MERGGDVHASAESEANGVKGERIGSYHLVRRLALGGMAEVFLARRLGEAGFVRHVVVKRLFAHLAEHAQQTRMFQDEARLLSELSHPSIPQVFELGRDRDTWYLVMEHVEGMTLAELIPPGHPPPLDVAVGVVLQAAEALHHAHERRDRHGRPLRIVHRDVTPHNLMLTPDGVVKVMDFGVAQTAARSDTDPTFLKGTLSYMAPEQVRAEPVDRRADVFALGVVLYELTTGVRLFAGPEVRVMTTIAEGDVPPPRQRYPGYPPELEGVVMAALARDRASRLATTGLLAELLEGFAGRHGLTVGRTAVGRFVRAVVSGRRPERPRLELILDASGSRTLDLGPPSPSELAELDDLDTDIDTDIDTEIDAIPRGRPSLGLDERDTLEAGTAPGKKGRR
ncbi:MAG: serine/threonine-protein kinase [Sandaracinaceae bacterium]